ncbi:MAG: hypothetical protein H0T62_12545 [Parachlamydiaceae bacterium]|nr:hypothetical protein [Parachlamydiaceae bacterium]
MSNIMTIFAECWPKIESLTLDEFREAFDEVCDHIPFVSTLSNVICAVQKNLYLSEMKYNGTLAGNRYYTRLENKDFERYWLLFVPIFNLFAAAAFSIECANNAVLATKFSDCNEFAEPTFDEDISENSEQEMLNKLFSDPIDLPLVISSKKQKKTKNILKVNDFINVPDEIMNVIYGKFQLSALISFSKTCTQNWTSVNEYKKLLGTKINWLSRLQLLASNGYAHKAYCFCLSSSLGVPNLSIHLKESVHSKEVLLDHFLLKKKMRLETQLNPLELEKFNRDCTIFLFEYGTDEQLFSYIEKEIHQLQGVGVEVPFNLKLMNVRWLEAFGDSFFPLLKNERMTRFFPLLHEEEKLGILPLLLNVLKRYIDVKVKKAFNKKANKNKEFNNIYLKLSKLSFKKRLEVCEKKYFALEDESGKLMEKIKKIEAKKTTLFRLRKEIYTCLYQENSKSMLWNLNQIKSNGGLVTARIIHYLKSTEFIESSDKVNDMYLSEQFTAFHKLSYADHCSCTEEIILEICSTENFEEMNTIREKKFKTLVRIFVENDISIARLLGSFFIGLSGNVNFNIIIIREILNNIIPKKDIKKIEKMFLSIWQDPSVNAFIDYCLELPKNCQAIYLSALLFYNSRSYIGMAWNIRQIYKERELNPADYPPLTPEAYQEAFFTRKL